MLIVAFCFESLGLECRCEPLTTTESLVIVKDQVNRKVERIKKDIQYNYEMRDRSNLLLRKEAVDTFLLPIYVIMELQGDKSIDLFRHFRYNYNKECNTTTKINHNIHAQLDKSVEFLKCNNMEGIKAQIFSCSYPYRGADYPLIMSGSAFISKDKYVYNIEWYEPYLANRDLVFPVHPEDLTIDWDGNRLCMYVRETNEEPIVEYRKYSGPVFNNPEKLYSVYDSTSLIPFMQINVEDCSNKNNKYYTYMNNQIIRDTELKWEGGLIKEIVVNQYPIQLRHVSDEVFNIKREIDGSEYKTEDYSPQMQVNYLESGRELRFLFESARRNERRVVIPSILKMYLKNSLLFEGRYDNFTKVDAVHKAVEMRQQDRVEVEVERRDMKSLYVDIVQKAKYPRIRYRGLDEIHNSSSGLMKRKKIKYNAYAAILMRDNDQLSKTLVEYKNILHDSNVSMDFYIFSLEALAQMAYEHIGDDAGWMVANTFLANAYAECSPDELQFHVYRLIDQCRLGFALMAVDVYASRNGDCSSKSWVNELRESVNQMYVAPDSIKQWVNYPYYNQQMVVNMKIKKMREEQHRAVAK
ncbi:hypothetical protein LLG95_09670 [bacterium]|nr:hypothetical protein [bacterium]